MPRAAAGAGPSRRIGVLALQGAFAAHIRALEKLGVETREVRTSAQLEGLDGLVLPGGESSTLLKLMEGTDLEQALRAFHAAGGALMGTCAGLILLARRVTAPVQRSLGLLDVEVERNAYGRQLDSFEGNAEWAAPEILDPAGAESDAGPELPLVFIRAPRIVALSEDVTPLARCRGDVVLARQGRILVAAFHPELSDDLRIHAYFADCVTGSPSP